VFYGCCQEQRGPKTGPFKITPMCYELEKRSIYQNVQLFDSSKIYILNFAISFAHVKKKNRTILKIPNNLNMTSDYCTQVPQNSESTQIINICRSTGIVQVY